MVLFYPSCLIILLIINSIHALSLFQGTSPKIIQDVVWLYSNSSSLDYTNTDFSPIYYEEAIHPMASDMNQINKTGLRGILYDRGYSCSWTNSTSPIHNLTNPNTIQKVALIKMNDQCSFRDKIMNAQIDGSNACIIYPPDPSQPFYIPNVDIYNGSITIPVFYVPNDIGQRLFNQMNSFSTDSHSLSFNNNVTANQVVRVLMLPGSIGTPNPWEITLLIMIAFLAVGFISSVCLHTYLWRKNRRLHRMIEEGQLPPTLDMLPMGKRILDTEKIDLFPIKILTQQDIDDRQKKKVDQEFKRASTCSGITNHSSSPNNDAFSNHDNNSTGAEIDDSACVICLDSMEVDQKIRQLPCQHEYHCHCIDPWLTSKSGECPLCKFDCVAHVISPEELKATEEAHAYYLNTDVNLFHVFVNYIRQRIFIRTQSTPHQ